MNCFQSSQLLLSGASSKDAEHIFHLDSCESCKRLSAEISHNDSLLCPAFSVQAPEGFADNIIKECFEADDHRRLFSLKKPLSVAAGIAASIVIGILFVLPMFKEPTPKGSDLVLAHVIEELGVLNIEGDLGDDRLRWELKNYGLTLKSSIGRIKWIGRCELPGGLGLHIVADNEKFGIISIIVPPLSYEKTAKVDERGIVAWMINIDSIQVGLASSKSEQTLGISRYIESAITESPESNEV